MHVCHIEAHTLIQIKHEYVPTGDKHTVSQAYMCTHIGGAARAPNHLVRIRDEHFGTLTQDLRGMWTGGAEDGWYCGRGSTPNFDMVTIINMLTQRARSDLHFGISESERRGAKIVLQLSHILRGERVKW